MCVLYQDRQRLKNIIDQENDIYLDLRSGLVNKIKYKSGTYPFIDIFFMVPELENGQIVYKCALKSARDSWTNETYLESELVPLKKTKFGTMEIAIPNEYERYFVANFGKNWNTEGVICYDHKNNINIDPKIKWTLRASDDEPAKPFYIEQSFDSHKNTWWQF